MFTVWTAWVLTPAAHAQPVPDASETAAVSSVLKGRVFEFGSGSPLESAEVSVGGRTTVTDEDGRFEIEVAVGDATVAVTLEDYVDGSFEETFGLEEATTVTYRLERRTWENEYIIYGESRREEVSKQVITIEELRRVPGSFGDPIRAIQSLPGVARPSSIEGDIVVRGAEGLNTGTFVDEVRVPFLFHFLAGRSVVSPDLIEDVEFFAGGMPSRFGDVTQAVVNARTSYDGAEKGLHGDLHVDLLDTGGSFSANLGKGWTVRGAGRLSWFSSVIAVGQTISLASQGLNDPDVKPARLKFPYNDWQLRIVRTDGPDRFSFTAMGALDGLKLRPARFRNADGDFDPYEPDPNTVTDFNDIIENRFSRLTFRWDHTEPEFEHSTWASVGQDRQRNIIPGLGTVFSGPEGGQIDSGWFRARHEQRHVLSERSTLRFGGDVRVQPSEVKIYANAASADEIPTTRDVRAWASPFIEWQQKIGTTYVAPGFRGSWHRVAGRAEVLPEPRLTVRHPVSESLSLTGFTGLFTQAPPTDRYAEGVGLGNVEIMKSFQTSVGLEGRWSSGWSLDVNAYYSEMRDINVKEVVWSVDRDPENPGSADLVQRPFYEPLRGRAFGLETQLRMRPNNGWFGWVGLTLGRALRIDGDEVFPSRYDTPVSFIVVAAKDLPKGWGISGRFRLTSGQPFTPQAGVFVGDDYLPLPLARNSARFPMFKQLDVRLDKTWTMQRARWTFYLDVYNTLNHKNPFLATYDYSFEERITQAFIPILPTLGVEVSY